MTYLLRNIPDDLWIRVKRRAELDGHALRFVILKLLERYASHGVRLTSAQERPGDDRLLSKNRQA